MGLSNHFSSDASLNFVQSWRVRLKALPLVQGTCRAINVIILLNNPLPFGQFSISAKSL